jgi:DHA1 family bicyclomycin/chloramphenicol resistance-like MFS transporter
VNSPALPTRRSFIVTLSLLTATAALSVDVCLPAVPAMADALASTVSQGQRIVGVFIAGMALGQIPCGLLSDRMGRLPILTAGLALFTASAVVVASSANIDLILVARFAQGIGAAAAVALAPAIVRDITSGKQAARLMSLMTMIFTSVPVVAPSIGAMLMAKWGWRAPFTFVAIAGFLAIAASRAFIGETHAPSREQHLLRQLATSFLQFFSFRQSIFGLLLVVLLPAGFMSVITVSSALIVESYGYSPQAFGFVFACMGLSILTGAATNRVLVYRFDMLQMIAIGVTLIGASGLQLLFMAWLNHAPLWWLWGNVCLFMFSLPIVMPNAVVIALDPMPNIAGVASSIIGTLQNVFGATGALVGALMYNGTIRGSVTMMATVAFVVVTIFLLRRWIVPGGLVHQAGDVAVGTARA